ncbi:hypothetical protein A2704_06440 [Candidatus Kaiserbacteria bacterium RIFCSPHIGHO2_01_FULL_54_36b]|nr:MAG: hypothetical protein A2704_06440 [Candidatus Kaiserbacteria bacterium RIFCSPHIGHO2_01_FULL_54_36b]
MGLGLGILEGFTAAIREQGGTDEDIHRLATAEGRAILADMAKVAVEGKNSYPARFQAAVAACGFTWWNQAVITAANFPGETFGGGEDYDLEYRQLPSKSGGYCADEIDVIVAGWSEADKTVLGSASAGDGIFFLKEVKDGRREQPNGWIVCPGSTSVDGVLLYLHRCASHRVADVYSTGYQWRVEVLVLLRKVRKS